MSFSDLSARRGILVGHGGFVSQNQTVSLRTFADRLSPIPIGLSIPGGIC
ncbi:Hypothetical protein FKW44_023768 [Caligus rogercresseyi]|uniref:Uncharacterized protein n=1 Tax=Caligus rogercresseyi TaxID=217165 RepID=A0A7T8GQ71_CALRO|nr:Hypothetical protein FKW44_023768 [Caligus rogercresseyi]